jgi:hypothetical protein
MGKEYWLRKAHRYLSVFVGVQLLLWVVSGLYFTVNDIEKIRGQHLRSKIDNDIKVQAGQLADISAVLISFRKQNPSIESIKGVELRLLLGQAIYEIAYNDASGKRYQLANAQTGEFMPMLDESSAMAVAKADFSENAGVLNVTLLEIDTPHAEYRGRDLPIYRVSMDHASGVNIYVSAYRGIVTARRNSSWRIFDFLWMLHTMDYSTRDDFNNIQVKVFSILGLITVLSGFLLWGMTSRVFNKNKPN